MCPYLHKYVEKVKDQLKKVTPKILQSALVRDGWIRDQNVGYSKGAVLVYIKDNKTVYSRYSEGKGRLVKLWLGKTRIFTHDIEYNEMLLVLAVRCGEDSGKEFKDFWEKSVVLVNGKPIKKSNKVRVGLVMRARNCERDISALLRRVRGCVDKISIVVDESEDDTLEVVKYYADIWMVTPEPGYVDAWRQISIDMLDGEMDWILMLDADEMPDDVMMGFVKRVGRGDTGGHDAFMFNRQVYLDGYRVWQDPPQIRLLRYYRERVMWNDKLHDMAVGYDNLGRGEGMILHYHTGFERVVERGKVYDRYMQEWGDYWNKEEGESPLFHRLKKIGFRFQPEISKILEQVAEFRRSYGVLTYDPFL